MADADRLVTVMRNRVSCGDRGRLLDQRELQLPYLDYPSLDALGVNRSEVAVHDQRWGRVNRVQTRRKPMQEKHQPRRPRTRSGAPTPSGVSTDYSCKS